MIHTLKNGKKRHLAPDLSRRAQIRTAIFFFLQKIRLRQSLDIMNSFHHVQYQKKTSYPILREFSDGRTDRRTRVIS